MRPLHALYVYLLRTERNAPCLIFPVLAPPSERAPPSIFYTRPCAALLAARPVHGGGGAWAGASRARIPLLLFSF